MKDREIEEVARILNKWNPLGDDAKKVTDLDGYRTEAIDIIFHLKISQANAKNIVMQVLNQAFDLSLTKEECSDPENEIITVLKKT